MRARSELDPRAVALLEQIRAAPDDDAPRLVLADLIADAHPERAELIAAQCTSRRPRGDLEAAFRRTLAGWLDDAPPCVRGFVPIRELELPAARFLARRDDLFRCAPGATRLHLREVRDHAEALAALPALARYEHLSFAHERLEEFVEPLARSPHLAQLRSLDLGGTHLSLDELRVLLRARAYPALERLNLAGCRHAEAIGALGGAPFAGTLRRLGLDHCPFGGAAIPLLAELPRLDAVSIARGDLTDEHVHALARLRRRFVEFGLRANRFGFRGTAALAASPVADELEELDVRGSPIGDGGCLAIAGSPRLRRLRALAIGGDLGSRPGPALAARIAASVFAPTLERLELSGCDLRGEGMPAFVAGPFPKLTHLDLSYSFLGDSVHALVRAPYFRSLRYLNPTSTVLHDRGARALRGGGAPRARPRPRAAPHEPLPRGMGRARRPVRSPPEPGPSARRIPVVIRRPQPPAAPSGLASRSSGGVTPRAIASSAAVSGVARTSPTPPARIPIAT